MRKASPLATLLSLPLSLALSSATAVDFEKQILPVLEAKCVECHRAPYEDNGRTKKPKAGLRMDGAWAIMMGSENGAVLVPGDAKGSEIFHRVTLPEEDEDFMPPTGKADPLTPKEIKLLEKWIEEGADFGGWTGNLEGKPKELTNAGEELPVSEIQEVYNRLAEGLPMPDEETWTSVTEQGGRVLKLARTSPLLSVDFRLAGEEATDENIGSVRMIAPNVAHLDLSKTAVTDEGLAVVVDLPNLVRLDLSRTSVGDDGLEHLRGLDELRYLNLYGSEVSDAGLVQLEKLTNLEAVYLWQSKATGKGAKRLAQALPDAKINFK
ncbi:MAG: c-type cytochrome domain-containing protein [Verrucomicrobiales bacterium]